MLHNYYYRRPVFHDSNFILYILYSFEIICSHLETKLHLRGSPTVKVKSFSIHILATPRVPIPPGAASIILTPCLFWTVMAQMRFD